MVALGIVSTLVGGWLNQRGETERAEQERRNRQDDENRAVLVEYLTALNEVLNVLGTPVRDSNDEEARKQQMGSTRRSHRVADSAECTPHDLEAKDLVEKASDLRRNLQAALVDRGATSGDYWALVSLARTHLGLSGSAGLE